MKKKLVEINDLDSYICQAQARIYVDDSMILTPGARDELRRKKITIDRDGRPGATCGGGDSCPAKVCSAAGQETDSERLLYGVAAMVREEFGIEDLQQLQVISCRIVDILKQNI